MPSYKNKRMIIILKYTVDKTMHKQNNQILSDDLKFLAVLNKRYLTNRDLAFIEESRHLKLIVSMTANLLKKTTFHALDKIIQTKIQTFNKNFYKTNRNMEN